MRLSQQQHQWSSTMNKYGERHEFNQETKNPEGRSLLTGPIPATPGYEYDVRASSAPSAAVGVARVHGPDAKANYKRATNGTGVPFLFEVQGRGIPTIHGTAAKPPVNHLDKNVRRLRNVLRESRERQASREQSQPVPVRALWRSKHYDHVQSKVKQRLDEDTYRSLSRPQSARNNFLLAHENTGPEYFRSQSAAGSRRSSIAGSVDLTAPQANTENQADFIKINAQWAKTIPKTRKTMSTEAIEETREKNARKLHNYNENQKGRVPEYIERIKEKRTQDIYQERANAPDPDCPIGHVRMDNDKRVSTLRQLELNRAELQKKFSHLPMRNDTVTIRRTKEEIEKKIVDLDEAITIFSKPKVFVKAEE